MEVGKLLVSFQAFWHNDITKPLATAPTTYSALALICSNRASDAAQKSSVSCGDTEICESQEYAWKHRTLKVCMKTESQPAHLGWWRSHLKHGDERASTVRPQLVHAVASSLKLLNTFITGTHLF